MAEKKNPYSFTIGFNAKNVTHVQAAHILNQYGRGEKADYIAKAILAYEGKSYERTFSVDPEALRDIIRELLAEECGKDTVKESKPIQKETIIDISEKAAKDPEVVQCLSRGLAAFRHS
ncbi:MULTISPECIES: hypothetical protein [Lachnospiraceae]|uniref:hypothetical protein n=1 Tax=Lachnospiraceae TaxID=186803 RepID=UPI00210A5F15|nr:hypothetical protein [Blautia producta]